MVSEQEQDNKKKNWILSKTRYQYRTDGYLQIPGTSLFYKSGIGILVQTEPKHIARGITSC